MTALAPHPGLLDPARQSGLDRAAQPLRSCRIVEELGAPSAVERDGIQLSRNLFELVEHLREHASPSGTGTDRSSATSARTCVRHVKPCS
jgi:hypothetical protein